MERPGYRKEKRTHQRIKSAVGTRVIDAGIANVTHLRNISRGGAFIHNYVQTDYQIGQKVTVSLPSKKHKTVELISKIVWKNTDGIGVKFLGYRS